MLDRDTHFVAALRDCRGRGRPIRRGLREWLQNQFHSDFANVRIHNDELAAQLTAYTGANAFANGTNVFFAPEKYCESYEGIKLLAHELAHVLQQRSGAGTVRRGAAGDIWELEAQRAANAVVRGEVVHVAASPGCPTLQLDEKKFHEKWGGLGGVVPFAGSYSEMTDSRLSWWRRGLGAVFFVADCTIVGGLAVKGVKAIATVGAKTAIRTGENKTIAIVTKEATKTGTKSAGEVVTHTLPAVVNNTGKSAVPVLESGASMVPQVIEAASKSWDSKYIAVFVTEGGWRHHAATYIVDVATQQAWKIQGGLSKLRKLKISEIDKLQQIDRVNTLSVMPLAIDTVDSTLDTLKVMKTAWGCGNAQARTYNALFGKTLSQFTNAAPMLADAARFLDSVKSGSQGLHYVLNAKNIYIGTMVQTTIVLGASTIPRMSLAFNSASGLAEYHSRSINQAQALGSSGYQNAIVMQSVPYRNIFLPRQPTPMSAFPPQLMFQEFPTLMRYR